MSPRSTITVARRIGSTTGKVYEEATATCRSAKPGDHPTLRLTTDLRLGLEGREARARTRLVEGDNVYVALSWSDLPAPQTFDEAADKMWQTSKSWREWVTIGKFPDHPWRRIPTAQCAHTQGAHLRTDRSPTRGFDDLATGNTRRRTQLGLSLRVGSRFHLRAVGPLHARVGP